MADTANPRQNVTFASNGGASPRLSGAAGVRDRPGPGGHPGVVGADRSTSPSLTDRFAAEGFVALAPDLYGGATTHDADEAGRLMSELPVDRAGPGPGRRGRLPAGHATT